jgi:hypothetical protein
MGKFFEAAIERLVSGLVEKASARKLAGLLESYLLKPFVKLLSAFSAVFVFLADRLDRVATYIEDRVGDIIETLVLLSIRNNPQLQKAASEMTLLLWSALRVDRVVVVSVLIASIVALISFICLPLLYKVISRRRLKIFISFNNTREDLAETLQNRFHKDGTKVFRIPFDQAATHQNVVISATEGIKKCDSFLCLPGLAASYVEHEVFAATTSTKPVVFLISEKSGTLPNTADKRYPVFRLEVALREQFSPLIEFIYYIGADFKSTWELCKRALRHPYMQISAAATLSVGTICFFVLLVYCFYRVNILGEELAKKYPSFEMVQQPVVLVHFFIFVIIVSFGYLIVSYSALCIYNLIRQFGARNKARLKTVGAQFNRDDWIGKIPGLLPGTAMYECLFESAPSAHHESGRKEGDWLPMCQSGGSGGGT